MKPDSVHPAAPQTSVPDGVHRADSGVSVTSAAGSARVTEFNVGRWCLSEDECIAQGLDFAAYERGVSDAAKAFSRNAASERPADLTSDRVETLAEECWYTDSAGDLDFDAVKFARALGVSVSHLAASGVSQ